MINTLRSEWIKLRTVRVHWVLAIIAIAFPIVVATLTAILANFGPFDDDLSGDFTSIVVGTGVVTAMLLGAMSAITLTSDYGHNTIRPTFAATPARLRVHAAKLIVNSTAVAGMAAIAMFVSWFAAQSILSGRDLTISIGDDDVIPSLLSLVALAVLVSAFGYALGLMIRNSPATVTILLLWPLLIESLVGGLFAVAGWEGVNRYLPYNAAIQAVVADDFSTDVLGRPLGLVWFGGVIALMLAVGATLDLRRDA